MPITSLADLDTAVKQRFLVTKASLSSQTIGGSCSFWRSAGNPGVGDNTGSTAACTVCNNTTTGAIPFVNPPAGAKTHISRATTLTSLAYSFEVHDRLLQAGGMDGVSTTNFTFADLNLQTQAGVSNIAERMGRSDYTSVQWWLEWTAATGVSGATYNFNYISGTDGSAQNLTAAIPASMAIGRMLPMVPNRGHPIKGVSSFNILSSTGTAGEFRIVATVQRCELYVPSVPLYQQFDWPQLGLPVIYDSSCLFIIAINNSTASPASNFHLTLSQG